MTARSGWLVSFALVVIAACCIVLVASLSTSRHDGHEEAEVTQPVESGAIDLSDGTARQPAAGPPPSTDHPPQAASTLAVHVVDEAGRPVPDAFVSVLDLVDQEAVSGTSNEDGVCFFDSSPRVFSVSARHGQRTAEPLLAESAPAEGSQDSVTVVIPDQRVIRGRVLSNLGNPIANARVLAEYVNGGRSENALISEVESGSWAGPQATTDVAGRFQLSVASESVVVLYAGGQGFALEAGPPARLGPLDSSPEIILFPVFGTVFEFELEDRSGTWNWTVFSGSIYPHTPVPHRVPSRASLVLGGMPVPLTGFRAWPRFTVLTLAEDDVEELGEATIRGAFPGFESFEVAAPLQRVGREIRSSTVRLADLSSGRGSLLVTFSGRSSPARAPAMKDWCRGNIYLLAENGDRIQCPVWDVHSGPKHLAGIPAGVYSVFFSHDGASTGCTTEVVEVRAGETTEAEVAFSDLGSIELDLRQPNGAPVASRVTVVATGPRGAERPRERRVVLAGPPYVVDLLPQGDYALRIIPRGLKPIDCQAHVTDEHQKTLPIFASQ